VGQFIFGSTLLLKLIYAVSMVSFSVYVLLFGAQRSQCLCYYLLNFDILNFKIHHFFVFVILLIIDGGGRSTRASCVI